MCNDVFFVFIFRIDLYRGNVSGELLWGVILNYSKNNVNVRLFIVNKNLGILRVFFVVFYDIL